NVSRPTTKASADSHDTGPDGDRNSARCVRRVHVAASDAESLTPHSSRTSAPTPRSVCTRPGVGERSVAGLGPSTVGDSMPGPDGESWSNLDFAVHRAIFRFWRSLSP